MDEAVHITSFTNIVVALAGLAGVGFTAFMGYLKLMTERTKLIQAEQEMRFQRAALEFPDFIEEWGEISKDIVRLMSETNVDRFLILRAWNGYLEPRWTTAVYQIRETDQEPVSYVHFELDESYILLLRDINRTNTSYMEVESMPDSKLRDVYLAEGVQASLICHLATFQPVGTQSRAHTYCTFATHSDEHLDSKTITRCSIIAARLKGLATSFDNTEII